MTLNVVAEQVKQMPARPGVYLMKDAGGTVLYIGKAARLRHRVRSYFSRRQQPSPKLRRLVARVADIDFFVTGSEQEALVLELNLIKRHRPYYNVRLKDDKNFPYLKIDPDEDWPRVQITRHLEGNGGRYFGPFASARSIRQALKVIKDIFPFRPCSRNISRALSRPCLEYDIHNCSGPCVGAITREEYAEIIKQLTLFLEGKHELVLRRLEDKMKQAAGALEYEAAARTRDQLQSVKEIINWQRMATTVKGEQDVVAYAQNRDQAYVQVYFIRGGKLIGREGFTLQGTRSEEPSQIMAGFVKHFYDSASYIPPLILLQHPVEGRAVIESWLKDKRGSKVRIQVPRKGGKKQLLDTVAENAARGLQQLTLKQLSAPATLNAALREIKKLFGLQRLPQRIEGYDISNIQGQAAVGSMVVFDRGRPRPAHYRRFRIKTVSGADDYAMLREVIRRRFGHLDRSAGSWSVLPDLILVDGGRGQLSSVLAAMRQAGVGSMPVIGLAKENEDIFIPGKPQPLSLPQASPGLHLLQRIRDEAHRFALGYHHKLRKKQTFTSALDAVPGIGPGRKRSLMRKFGSVPEIREASVDELAGTSGVSRGLARKIKEYL